MAVLDSLIPLGLILFLLAAWLVQHYAAPGTAIPTKALATLSFGLGFSGIALLPIDLSITTSTVTLDSDGANSSATDNAPNATYVPWMVTYWSTFVLAWLVLPLVRETLLSGQFTLVSRLKDGARKAVRGIIILVIVGIIAVVALAIHLHSWHVVPVLMALGNTYGLLLVALLLGYGLVDLPRWMWRLACPESELRRSRIMAAAADEELFDAVWELQDCEEAIDAAVQAVECSGEAPGDNYKRCLDDLVRRRNATATLNPELQSRRTGEHRKHDDESEDIVSNDDEKLSLEYLAGLNARLKLAQAKLVSAEQRWNALVKRSSLFTTLADGSVPTPSQSQAETSENLLPSAQLSTVGGRMQFFWMKRLRYPFYRLISISMAVLSVMVLWSEATLALPVNLSPFGVVLGFLDGDTGRNQGLLFQIFALVPLLYMSVCVYGSLFKLSVFGPYCLRGSKQSHDVSLVFNAQYLVRLQFPLGYNYLLMLKYDTSSTNCAFSKVMSNMSTVPFLGTSFSVYAPLLILALCAFTVCNGYPRLLAALGIEHEDALLMADQETLDGKVNEGIRLLRKHDQRAAGNNSAPCSPNSDSFQENGISESRSVQDGIV